MSALADPGAVESRLSGLADRIRTELSRALLDEAASLADRAQALAGGALGDSVQVEGDGLGAAVGSDLPYARLRELGFQGSESVKAGLRQIRQVFGRPVVPHPIAVQTHQRQVDLPARPFLAPALDPAALADAVVAALELAVQS